MRADELSTDHHLTTLLVGSFLRDSLAEFYVPTIFCLYGNQPEFLCELHKILHYIIAFPRMSQFSDNCDEVAWFADFLAIRRLKIRCRADFPGGLTTN